MNRSPLKILLLFSLTCAFAQAQYNDAWLWLGLNLEKKITSKISVSLNPEARFYENVTELGNAFVDAGVTYKFSKAIKASVNYRFSQRKRVENYFASRHRYYADLGYRKKFGKVVLAYRLRLQQQYSQYNSRANGRNPYSAVRNKLLFKYDLEKRYTPFVSGEIWYGGDYRSYDFNRFRVVGGFDFEFNKLSGITASYIFQRQFNENDPRTDYIVSLSYNYSF